MAGMALLPFLDGLRRKSVFLFSLKYFIADAENEILEIVEKKRGKP